MLGEAADGSPACKITLEVTIARIKDLPVLALMPSLWARILRAFRPPWRIVRRKGGGIWIESRATAVRSSMSIRD